MTVISENTSIKTKRLSIPHPLEKDCAIVGTLEQVAPEQPTDGRKIVLILHGSLGHKDYLFQKKLALRLPIDSFRFDFRGNHESGGISHMGKFHHDVDDLSAVIVYLTKELGYVVDTLVGHSRGSVVAMLWLCQHREDAAKNIRRFVNVSGRYRMERIYDILESDEEELKRVGYIERTITVARKPVTTKVTREDYDEFASIDTSVVWTQFPAHIDVLSLHGMKDAVVPPYDAFIYARAYGARSSATHTLRYVEDADHNFTGMPEEVIETVLEWMVQQEKNELRTGVWHNGVKGKL